MLFHLLPTEGICNYTIISDDYLQLRQGLMEKKKKSRITECLYENGCSVVEEKGKYLFTTITWKDLDERAFSLVG